MEQAGPIPQKLEHALQHELDEGERLLWCACPDRRTFVRMHMTASIVFIGMMAICGGFLLAGVGFMSYGLLFSPETTLKDQHPLAIAAASIGFFGCGYLGYRSCFVERRRAADSMAYAITSHRAIVLILDSRGRASQRSYPFSQLGHLARRDLTGDVGSLLFCEAFGEGARNDPTSPRIERHGFIASRDVRRAEKILRAQVRLWISHHPWTSHESHT